MTPPTDNQAVMPLEEVILKLTEQRDRAKAGIDRTLAIIAEEDTLAKSIGEMALLDWRDMLARNESALHHLEAGKRERDSLTMGLSVARSQLAEANEKIDILRDWESTAFLDWLLANCKIIHWPGGGHYPIEHAPAVGKDSMMFLKMAMNKEGMYSPTSGGAATPDAPEREWACNRCMYSWDGNHGLCPCCGHEATHGRAFATQPQPKGEA